MDVPSLVGTLVDDGSHTAHHLAIAKGHEVFRLATLERGVLAALKGGHLIEKQIGDGILVATIEVVVELYELS
jgi:hypothetical protein